VTIKGVSRPPVNEQIRAIGRRSRGEGGAARSASLICDGAAQGPSTMASAPQVPGRLGREGAVSREGATL
jgi:hypothetical protein